MADAEQPSVTVGSKLSRSPVSLATMLRLGLGLLIGGSVLAVVANVADDLPGATEVLSDASWRWLVAAVVVQAINYALLGFQLSRLVGGSPRLGRLVAVRVAVLVYGLGTLVPGAPAPGMVLAARELVRRGIEPGRAALAFVLSAWFSVRSFAVLSILTAVTATLRGRVPGDSRALVLGGSGFGAAALALSVAIVKRPALADRVGRLLEVLNWRGGGPTARQDAVHVQSTAVAAIASRGDGFRIASATFGSRLADAICLRLALVSVGVHVGMGVVLIAYVIAILVAIVPLLPAGLGLVEATIPVVLHHYGVPLDAAVAGTVAWRVVTLLLPGLVGLVSYASLRLETCTPVEVADGAT